MVVKVVRKVAVHVAAALDIYDAFCRECQDDALPEGVRPTKYVTTLITEGKIEQLNATTIRIALQLLQNIKVLPVLPGGNHNAGRIAFAKFDRTALIDALTAANDDRLAAERDKIAKSATQGTSEPVKSEPANKVLVELPYTPKAESAKKGQPTGVAVQFEAPPATKAPHDPYCGTHSGEPLVLASPSIQDKFDRLQKQLDEIREVVETFPELRDYVDSLRGKNGPLGLVRQVLATSYDNKEVASSALSAATEQLRVFERLTEFFEIRFKDQKDELTQVRKDVDDVKAAAELFIEHLEQRNEEFRNEIDARAAALLAKHDAVQEREIAALGDQWRRLLDELITQQRVDLAKLATASHTHYSGLCDTLRQEYDQVLDAQRQTIEKQNRAIQALQTDLTQVIDLLSDKSAPRGLRRSFVAFKPASLNQSE